MPHTRQPAHRNSRDAAHTTNPPIATPETPRTTNPPVAASEMPRTRQPRHRSYRDAARTTNPGCRDSGHAAHMTNPAAAAPKGSRGGGVAAEDAGFEPARAVNPTRVPGERHRPLGESSAEQHTGHRAPGTKRPLSRRFAHYLQVSSHPLSRQGPHPPSRQARIFLSRVPAPSCLGKPTSSCLGKPASSRPDKPTPSRPDKPTPSPPDKPTPSCLGKHTPSCPGMPRPPVPACFWPGPMQRVAGKWSWIPAKSVPEIRVWVGYAMPVDGHVMRV